MHTLFKTGCFLALFQLLTLLSPAANWQPTDTARVNQLLDFHQHNFYQNPEAATDSAALALEISQNLKNDRFEARSLNQLGNSAWVAGDLETALDYYQRAGNLFEMLEDEAGEAKIANNKGMIFQAKGYNRSALAELLKAWPYFEKEGEPAQKATLLNNMGNVYQGSEEFESAMWCYAYGLRILRKAGHPDSCLIYNNMGLLADNLGHDQQSRRFLETAADCYTQKNNPLGQASAWNNLGGWHARHDNFARADSFYQLSLQMARETGQIGNLATSYLKFSELNLRKENATQAIQFADSALKYFELQGGLWPLASSHLALSLGHELAGNYPAALKEYKAYKTWDDSLKVKSSKDGLEDLRLNYTTKIRNQQLATLHEKAQQDRWIKLLLGSLAALILAGAVVVVQRQSRLRARENALQEKEKEVLAAQNALTQAELRNAELEREALELKVQHKSRTVSDLAMNVIRHNDLLKTVDQGLKSLRNKVSHETRQEVQELLVMVLGQLGADQQRVELQQALEESEQQFFMELHRQFPALTEKDRRLCALIRMGYSSKEIAALVNINVNSVEMGRYRLRKKIGLESGEGLKEFLDGIGI